MPEHFSQIAGAEEEVKLISNTDDNEVVTLMTEEESAQAHIVYPSSPINVLNEQMAELCDNSIEIDAPFCQDLSTSRDGEDTISSKSREDVISESQGIMKHKRLLDEILEDDSSTYSSRNIDTSDSLLDSVKHSLTKFRDSTRKEKTNGGSISSRKLITSVSTRCEKVPKVILHSRDISNRNCSLSTDTQNILDKYPLSPINIPSSEIVGDTAVESPLRPRPKSKSIRSSPRKQQPDNISLLGLDSSKNQAINRPTTSEHEVIEFSIRSFSSERDHKEMEPKDEKRSSTDTIIRGATQSNILFVNHQKAEASSVMDGSKLQNYIVQGKNLTTLQSQALVNHWIRTDKGLFKQVNQIYRDNTKARESIIVEMPDSLFERYEKCCANLKELLAPAALKVQDKFDLPVIKFQRKCNSTYDFSNDVYFPCEETLVEENIELLYYDAQEFFERYKIDKRSLFSDINSLSSDDRYLIVILTEVNKFKRALKAQENKRYKERVKEHLTGSQVHRESVKGNEKEIFEGLGMNELDIDQRIQHIDRMWGVKIHTVSSDSDFIRSLPNLTSLIGKQRMDPNIRYMKYCHINVKSCKDQEEVLHKTLHEINRMPNIKANSVTAAYHSFQSVLADFEKGELKSGLDGKHLMTEAMEARLHKLFTCTDPNETIQ